MQPIKTDNFSLSIVGFRAQGSVELTFLWDESSLTHLYLLSADQPMVVRGKRNLGGQSGRVFPLPSPPPPTVSPALGHIAHSCSQKPHSTMCSHIVVTLRSSQNLFPCRCRHSGFFVPRWNFHFKPDLPATYLNWNVNSFDMSSE